MWWNGRHASLRNQCASVGVRVSSCPVIASLGVFQRGYNFVWSIYENSTKRSLVRVPFFRTFGRKCVMSLRGQKPEAIQLLPIYKGRKSVEYKSPKCPIMVTKMSTNLHFLSKNCTQKLLQFIVGFHPTYRLLPLLVKSF